MIRCTFGNFGSIIIDCFDENTEVIIENEVIDEVIDEVKNKVTDKIYHEENKKLNKKIIFLYNYNISNDTEIRYYKTNGRNKEYSNSKNRNINFNKFS